MDKKFTIIGILCIVAAIFLGIKSVHQQQAADQYKKDHPELFAQQAVATGSPAATAAASSSGTGAAVAPANGTAAITETAPAPLTSGGVPEWLTPATPEARSAPAATRDLSNDYITVTLTEDGGAIKSVTLKQVLARYNSKDPLVFNADAPEPALLLSVPDPARANDTAYWSWTGSKAVAVSGSARMPPVPLLGHCEIDPKLSTATSVTFRGTTVDGLEFTRTYTLGSGDEDPYVIHHTTTIANHGNKSAPLNQLFVGVGMAPPPSPEASSISLYYLDFAYFNGEAAGFVTVSEFMPKPARLLGIIPGSPKQKNDVYAEHMPPDLQWVSVKDQFFAAVLTPKDIKGSGFYARGVDVKNEEVMETTVSGDLELNLGVLPAGAEKKLALDYYVGPKNYVKLDKMGDHQDLIMQFGMFGGFSKVLLVTLIAIHTFIAPLTGTWAWGFTIIVFTIIIKGVTWPLTAVQVRSGRRMQEIQAPLKALKEKYKDNPQKMNTEMMELYKKHKINPLAGCLPLLITFPIFIAFNSMLRTSSEMRFQPFLWIHDLSQPDTITHIGGFAINILPLIMGLTMLVQMHMMPAPSADAAQARIMKFMPLLFLGFFYTMPSGMILYWTCQNLFTILQQYVTKVRKDPVPVAAAHHPKAKRR